MKTTLALGTALVFALGGFASSQNSPQRNIDTCLSGKYPALCDHGALTPEQLRQARLAEQRENLRVCMTGKYPALCEHTTLSPVEALAVREAERLENLRVCSSGKYPALCNHGLLSAAEATGVRAAEEAENLKTCMDGRYPSLCKHALLNFRRAQEVAAAEAAAARTQPPTRSAPTSAARTSGCDSGHWIESVSGNGKIIKLEDGTLWQVDDIDTITSMLWLPVSDVVVCGTKIVNTDDGESVAVTRLGGPTPSGRTGSAGSTAREYLIQASANDETFVINGEVFKAKTYCFNFNKGDRVVFVSGSPSGACSSAQLLNTRTGRTCNVWCE